MRYETYEVDNRRVIIINYEDRYIYLINGVYIYIFNKWYIYIIYIFFINTNKRIYILYIKTMYAWGCKA